MKGFSYINSGTNRVMYKMNSTGVYYRSTCSPYWSRSQFLTLDEAWSGLRTMTTRGTVALDLFCFRD